MRLESLSEWTADSSVIPMKVTEEVTEGSREHHIQHEPRLFRRKNEAGSGHARSTELGAGEENNKTHGSLYAHTLLGRKREQLWTMELSLKKEKNIYYLSLYILSLFKKIVHMIIHKLQFFPPVFLSKKMTRTTRYHFSDSIYSQIRW